MKRISFYADRNRSGNLLHIETDGCIVNIRVGLRDMAGRPVTRVDVSPEDETRSPDMDGYYWRIATDGAPGVSRVIRDPEPGMHTIVPNPSAFSCAWCDADIEQAAIGGGWYDVATAQDGDGLPSPASLECDEAPDGTDTPSKGHHVPGGTWLLREARGWIADSFGADVDVALLSDRSVIEGVQRTYEGGWAAFVAASPA